MHPFDQGYMERREKRIQDMFVMRAISRAMALISVVLLVAMLVITNRNEFITFIMGTCVLGTGMAALVTYVVGRAESTAEATIQKEYAQLAALYEQATEKPKRHEEVHLSDDGELVTDEGSALEDRANYETTQRGG
ncbi:MAG: hypothetical protein KF716_03480 [Anaerolineae bacterium]|nr:hypothetical protein [Anaerolineae bacterium]